MSEEAHERKAALRILAFATAAELRQAIDTHWPTLAVRDLRTPQAGMVMLRGRMGGDGAAFNLGEATASRAAIELPSGERGFGTVLGRDPQRARLVAIADALWQRPGDRRAVEASLLEPVAARRAARSLRRASEAAATKVDFFTLVRGEDAA
jgi:alpha-D-ribose 1-methylphosphonate 5-triphosphate synthase subunit PhnG